MPPSQGGGRRFESGWGYTRDLPSRYEMGAVQSWDRRCLPFSGAASCRCAAGMPDLLESLDT